jgi:hypothetical protein
MDNVSCSTTASEFQPSGSKNCFEEADDHLATAIDRIQRGRADSATGAVKTCSFLVELLEGARVPLRRLSKIRESHPVAKVIRAKAEPVGVKQ